MTDVNRIGILSHRGGRANGEHRHNNQAADVTEPTAGRNSRGPWHAVDGGNARDLDVACENGVASSRSIPCAG
jgi:hypothetical protein